MRRLVILFPLTALAAVALWADETTPRTRPLPRGFVDLGLQIPSLRVEIRYQGTDNFLGHRVDGYVTGRGVASLKMAKALAKVQGDLVSRGLGLKIFDAYRPQRAVDQFVRWANDPNDTATKSTFYPNVAKPKLIPLGYIAERSGHSRGSAVDLTLIQLETGSELDMGSTFDLFDPRSHGAHGNLTKQQKKHRRWLHQAMVARGFGPYAEEWWHFTLKNEPYPDTYFDFPIQ